MSMSDELTTPEDPVENTPHTAEDDVPKSSGPTPTTEEDWLEALRQVIDPELMVNIVDLGLIYAVSADEEVDHGVAVEMTLTSPACPAGPQIVQQSKMALERLRDINVAKITLTMSPPWTPERMTDDARD
jgi:metal-sulfur cluster biosynthetic enzyme